MEGESQEYGREQLAWLKECLDKWFADHPEIKVDGELGDFAMQSVGRLIDSIIFSVTHRKSESHRNMTAEQYQQWRAPRKEAGLKIDPKTAEVSWRYGQTLDPYGVLGLPEEYWSIGRE